MYVISKLDCSPDKCRRFDIFSDSKSSIVISNVQWVSQELRRSKFYNTHVTEVQYKLVILKPFGNTT